MRWTSRPRRSAFRFTSCSAALCASASASTGRTAAPIVSPGPSRCRSRRCARSTMSWRQEGGGRQRLYGAQDQRLSARGPSAPARARLRPRRLLPRAQCRAQRDRRDPRSARGLSRGRRPGRRHPGRPQLQLQNRGLPEDGTRHGTLRSVLGRNRHAQSQGATTSGRAPPFPSHPASVCSAGATTDRTSSSRRWTWRSSTRRGTRSPSP